MSVKIRRFTGALLALLLVMSLIPARSVKAASSIDDFVTRCYKVAFQREPDDEGFKYWKGRLEKRELVGSTTVYQFIFSEEYLNQKTSDKQYIKDLYTMFMGREPDDDGYTYWCGQMAGGLSRQNVFSGFANSDEFYELCFDAGISAGYFTDQFPMDQVNNVNLFVERMYRITLDRIGDKDGQIYWVNGLLTGLLTGTSCAQNYIFSDEYSKKGLESSDYIKNLYLAFMGREADSDGLDYWCEQMSYGMSKPCVFAGFANSAEFAAICQGYGITVEPYKAPITQYARVRTVSRTDQYTWEGNTSVNKYVYEYEPNTSNVTKTLHYTNDVLVEYTIQMRSERLEATYTYAPDGSLLGKYEYQYGEGYYFNIYYKADGTVDTNLSSKCFYDYGNTKDSKVYTSTYKYYDYNDVLQSTSVTIDREYGFNTKTYDASGKLTYEYDVTYIYKDDRKIRENYTGTEGSGYIIFDYDSKGNMIRSTEYNIDGSLIHQTDYRFDKANRQIGYIIYNPDGSVDFQSSSVYDQFGNEIQYSYSGPDYSSISSFEIEAY